MRFYPPTPALPASLFENLFQALGQIFCHHSLAPGVHVNRVIEKGLISQESYFDVRPPYLPHTWERMKRLIAQWIPPASVILIR